MVNTNETPPGGSNHTTLSFWELNPFCYFWVMTPSLRSHHHAIMPSCHDLQPITPWCLIFLQSSHNLNFLLPGYRTAFSSTKIMPISLQSCHHTQKCQSQGFPRDFGDRGTKIAENCMKTKDFGRGFGVGTGGDNLRGTRGDKNCRKLHENERIGLSFF